MSESEVGGFYDDYPYPSLSYGLTHPDKLATTATLFGASPPPVEECRFLDIGCAVGGNILPMAYVLPNSIFTGIDYSARQIEIGQERLAELGAKNIRLLHMDIMDVPDDFGEYDYIVAHGLYSWIPQQVRDGLLAVIKKHLAPNGVAYLSYNVFPGGHMISMVREMMQYRTRFIDDPMEKISQARALIDMMVGLPYEDNQAFGGFIRSYHEAMMERFDQGDADVETLLLHDELAEINEPRYFHEVAEHAEEHGLQYISEVELFEVAPFRFPKDVRVALGKMSKNSIEFEQYLDFLMTRTFRKSIFCHKEVELSRRIKPDLVRRFMFSSYAEVEGESPDIKGPAIVQFKGKDGSIFATDHPLTKAALLHLTEATPDIIPFDSLATAGLKRLDRSNNGDVGQDLDTLAANLLQAFTYNESLIQFHLFRPPLVTEISEKPEASLVARWQASKFKRVTSLRHARIALDPMSRFVLSLLDGKHDHTQIADELMYYYEQGKIVLTPKTGKGKSKAKSKAKSKSKSTREVLERELQSNLEFFSATALLVG